MYKASKVLYTIGKVFNVFQIITASLTLLLGILIAVFGEQIVEVFQSVSNMITVTAGTGFIIGGAVALAVAIATLVLANNATRALNNGVTDYGPHIVMIVIGVFGDVFYLLGGIFGVVAESSQKNYGTY